MSRGPGLRERAIEAAFTAEPSRAFTVEALATIAFQGVNRVEKKHRVATLRAAHNVAKRLGWITMKGGDTGDGLTFYNPVDLKSYARARVRGLQTTRMNLRRGWTDGLERDLAALDDPDSESAHYMQPGGAWWEHVELERARRNGDHARAQEFEAKHEQARAGFRRRSAARGQSGMPPKLFRFAPDLSTGFPQGALAAFLFRRFLQRRDGRSGRRRWLDRS